MMVENIQFEIVKHIGTLKEYPTGWKKELNLVSWEGKPAVYDIRDWDAEHKHMSRGFRMTEDEVKIVRCLLGEEITHCKDCKWHGTIGGPMACDITDDQDFCSLAERI